MFLRKPHLLSVDDNDYVLMPCEEELLMVDAVDSDEAVDSLELVVNYDEVWDETCACIP